MFDWYKGFINWIESSELFKDYFSTLPIPLNNATFLSILLLIIAILIVRTIVDIIVRIVKRNKVKKRIAEDVEGQRSRLEENEELAKVARTMTKIVEEKTSEKEALEAEKEELQSESEVLKQKLYTSVHDGLTGLQNRRVFTEQMNEYLQNGTEYVLICFDVNNLKTTNDTFGHAKGDELLKTITETISKHFGEENVYRVGGDEFNVLISGEGFDPEELKRIDTELEDITAQKNDGVVYQTAYGYALRSEGKDEAAVLALADSRMYEDKVAKKGCEPR